MEEALVLVGVVDIMDMVLTMAQQRSEVVQGKFMNDCYFFRISYSSNFIIIVLEDDVPLSLLIRSLKQKLKVD